MQKIMLPLMLMLSSFITVQGQDPIRRPTMEELRRERLNGYTKVVLDWSVETVGFTRDQELALRDLLGKQVDRVQRNWLQNRLHSGNDIQVTYFAGDPGGAARSLPVVYQTPGLAKALGNLEQVYVIRNAVRERAAYHETLLADSYTGMLTKMLRISEEEQTVVRELLKTRYRLRMLNGAPTRSNLKDLKILGDEQLEQLVGKRMASLRFHIDEKVAAAGTTVKIEIPSPPPALRSSPNGLERHLTAAIRRACDKLEARYEISMRGRIRDIAVRKGLTDKQVRRLKLAATGIRKRKIREWMKEGRAALPETEDIVALLGEESLWQTAVRLSPIDLNDERLWIKVNEEITAANEGPPTSATIRDGLVSQTMLWLDQELWLRPEQRKPMWKLVDQAVTELHNDDLADQLRFVFRSAVQNMPAAEVEKLLTAQQGNAWRRICKPNVVIAVGASE